MQLFVHFSIVLHHRQNIPSNFLVFHNSEGISSRPADFLLLIIFRTSSSSSSVNCPRFISRWQLIISSVSLSMISGGGGSKQILENFFPLLRYFYLTENFLLWFWVACPSGNFIYSLSYKSWLSIFYWISDFIDLASDIL